MQDHPQLINMLSQTMSSAICSAGQSQSQRIILQPSIRYPASVDTGETTRHALSPIMDRHLYSHGRIHMIPLRVLREIVTCRVQHNLLFLLDAGIGLSMPRFRRAILNNLSRLRRMTIDVINFDEIAPLFEAWRDKHAPNFRHLEIHLPGHVPSRKRTLILRYLLNRGDSVASASS
jgi:hypothetical protein